MILLACVCAGAAAAAEPAPTVDLVLGFADALLTEGEYYRAITEYRRAIYLLGTQSGDGRAHAFVGIGRAYFMGGDFERASDWLRAHRGEYSAPGGWSAGERLFLRALLRVGELEEATQLANEHAGPEAGFSAGLIHAYARRWDAARESFTSAAPDPSVGAAARWNAQVAAAAAAAGMKRPAVAGALAVLPGLGYLYAGHPQSALAALLMNGLLITGSVQALRAEQYALGGLASFLALTWYAGNIYGSTLAAERYNDRRAEEFLEQLRE